jgi:hypothetical protein
MTALILIGCSLALAVLALMQGPKANFTLFGDLVTAKQVPC